MEFRPFNELVNQQITHQAEESHLAEQHAIEQERVAYASLVENDVQARLEQQGLVVVQNDIQFTLGALKKAHVRTEARIRELVRPGDINVARQPKYRNHRGWKFGDLDFVKPVYLDSGVTEYHHSGNYEGLFLTKHGGIFYYITHGKYLDGKPVDLHVTKPCSALYGGGYRSFDISEVRKGLAGLVAKTRT